ncbi:MAG: phospholipase D-like domain-containing protein [Ktedonobacteraceae bacterium]
MQLSDEEQTINWWAEGDLPVCSDSHVTYLVDGRTMMLTLCRRILSARAYLYLAYWGFTATMELVRGSDHRAGPDGSAEQEALLADLRADGLQDDDIAFWCTHTLSAQEVLAYAVQKGVDVKVLLWGCPELFSHYSPKTAHEQLTRAGVTCILDTSARGLLHHPIESLHQKITIVDGTSAFVGGLDPLIERGGEFDRWDTHVHEFATPLRRTHEGTSPHPWHDVHALIEGTAVGDVEYNFRQRWNEVVQRHHWENALLVPEHLSIPAVKSTSMVQIARTIPQHTYDFTTTGIQGIVQQYINALRNAHHFIYLENQYLWLRAYTGIDLPFTEPDSPDMELLLREMGGALRRRVTIVIILPDRPNVGRALTDASLQRLRSQAPEAIEEGRLQVFCLATSHREDGEHYRPIYVHAKVAILDDLWTTIGSANLNNRGMRDDTEMNVATLDAEAARNLRMQLMAEHLGLVGDAELFALARMLGQQPQRHEEQARAIHVLHSLQEKLSDPLASVQLMQQQAWENLNRYQAKEPLIGHLLPYLTAAEARQRRLPFQEAHGWIEER